MCNLVLLAPEQLRIYKNLSAAFLKPFFRDPKSLKTTIYKYDCDPNKFEWVHIETTRIVMYLLTIIFPQQVLGSKNVVISKKKVFTSNRSPFFRIFLPKSWWSIKKSLSESLLFYRFPPQMFFNSCRTLFHNLHYSQKTENCRRTRQNLKWAAGWTSLIYKKLYATFRLKTTDLN